MFLLYAMTLIAAPPADRASENLAHVTELDAINCRLDVPGYTEFAMAVNGEEHLARARHWTKIASANPFMNEYDLPQPIVVAGAYSTRRIAFTSNAIVAVLDLSDPATVARSEHVENMMDAGPMIDALVATGQVSRGEAEAEIKFRKFLGERALKDVTEPAGEGESYGSHSVIARTISNATTHPGKTFYGCSYRIEMLDRDGTPL